MIRVFNQYISVKSIILMALESVLIVLSLIVGARLRFWTDPVEFILYTRTSTFLLQAATVLIVLELCFYYNDLYDLAIVRIKGEQFARLAQALGAGCMLLGALYLLFPGLLVGRGVLMVAVALFSGAVALVRGLLDQVLEAAGYRKNVIILGNGELALTVAREFHLRGDLNFRVKGFVSSSPVVSGELFGRPILGDATRLVPIADENQAARIVIALEDQRGTLPVRDLVHLRVRGIAVEDANSVLAGLTGRVWLQAVRPSWFVYSGGFHRSGFTLLCKRSIDLAFSLAGLILFTPLMAAVAILIRLDSKGPVFYWQERVGLAGKVFRLLKFRSMRTDAEADNQPQWARKDDPRVTRVGRILRKFRLDELPQFVNVIRGEMSFVGPRPERPGFVEQLRERIPFYDERHSVRPGITGWAQVEFTYGSSIEDAYRKLEYDLFYLKSMSILFDLAIVFRTVRIVVRGHGGQ